jgi:hypothetical protein
MLTVPSKYKFMPAGDEGLTYLPLDSLLVCVLTLNIAQVTYVESFDDYVEDVHQFITTVIVPHEGTDKGDQLYTLLIHSTLPL